LCPCLLEITQHAYGKLALEEKLGKCTFQISPGAFFQVNTEGAEILYDFVVKQVKEVTSDPKQTLLLDVCCGTGTIGLTCMKEGVVGRVLGVDISEPAIDDAKRNAEKNGWPSEDAGGDSALVTTRFVASRAEQALASEMNEIRKGSFPIVAVVDPGRFDCYKLIANCHAYRISIAING
jgi:tRNA (uracil-5-)-methyltransferase